MGGASRGPTYPTIPHMALASSAVAGTEALDPALDEREGRPPHGESARGHVPRHRRAGGDIRVIRHRHRGDELRVAADEYTRTDTGEVLLEAVIVAGDGPGADVAVGPHLAITQVGEMVGLRPRADRRLLGLDEVADVHALREPGARAQPGEWPDDGRRAALGLLAPPAGQRARAAGGGGADQPRRAVETAIAPDAGSAAQRDVRSDHGVGADLDLRADVRGAGILERHTRRHPALDRFCS